MAKAEDNTDAAPAVSGALQPEAKSTFQTLKVATREYCIVRITSFNELEDLHKLEAGSVLQQNKNRVLADPAYSTGSARGQVSLAQNVFFEENIEKTVTFMSNVMAPGANDHLFVST